MCVFIQVWFVLKVWCDYCIFYVDIVLNGLCIMCIMFMFAMVCVICSCPCLLSPFIICW